jgi:hypothetical protein
MTNLLKLRTTLIKNACFKYAEAHGILIDHQDGFRLLLSIHDALAPIIMIMEDAKIYNEDIHIMYADVKGAFDAADFRTMFKHIRRLGIPSTFVDTCKQLHVNSTTNYNTPYGHAPSIDINRGTLQDNTLSPFLSTLFLFTLPSLAHRRQPGIPPRHPSDECQPQREKGHLTRPWIR